VTGDQWALALRGALVVVLLLTLLRPTLPRWVDRLNVVFLLDHSDSVTSSRASGLPIRLRGRAPSQERRPPRGDRVREEAVVDQPLLEPSERWSGRRRVSGRGTNIFQAFSWRSRRSRRATPTAS